MLNGSQSPLVRVDARGTFTPWTRGRLDDTQRFVFDGRCIRQVLGSAHEVSKGFGSPSRHMLGFPPSVLREEGLGHSRRRSAQAVPAQLLY